MIKVLPGNPAKAILVLIPYPGKFLMLQVQARLDRSD